MLTSRWAHISSTAECQTPLKSRAQGTGHFFMMSSENLSKAFSKYCPSLELCCLKNLSAHSSAERWNLPEGRLRGKVTEECFAPLAPGYSAVAMAWFLVELVPFGCIVFVLGMLLHTLMFETLAGAWIARCYSSPCWLTFWESASLVVRLWKHLGCRSQGLSRRRLFKFVVCANKLQNGINHHFEYINWTNKIELTKLNEQTGINNQSEKRPIQLNAQST